MKDLSPKFFKAGLIAYLGILMSWLSVLGFAYIFVGACLIGFIIGGSVYLITYN